MKSKAFILGIIILGFVFQVQPAEAKSDYAQSTKTYTKTTTGPRGNIHHSTVTTKQNTPTNHSGSTTLNNGGMITSQGIVTPVNSGLSTTSGTILGPDGRTISSQGTLVKTSATSGVMSENITGPNGNSATVDKTLTRNNDGSVSIS